MARLVTGLAVVLLLGLGAGCKTHAPPRPVRERLRILIPGSYKAHIKALLESGAREFSFGFDDIDWVDMPGYAGRDAVFPPSLAARFADSEPDADVLFIDLYRIGSYRPAWLTPFDSGPFATVTDDFRPAFLEGAKLADGKVYAIPWSAKGNFLFYRKDLVAEPPRTWEALQELCEQLPERGLPKTIRYCLLVNWQSVENDLYPVLWSLGGTSQIRLNTPEVAGFIGDLGAMMGGVINQSFVAMPRLELMDQLGSIHQRFANGEAVFMVSWNNRYRFMSDDLASKGRALPPIGMAPIPAGGAVTYSNIGTWGWIVPHQPKGAPEQSRRRHELAMRFVAEVSSQKAVEFLTEHTGLIPARRDVAVPKELGGVLSAEISQALEGTGTPGRFRFHDRGSDEFIHGYVRDAIRDVLLCQQEVTKPFRSGLVGDCARYFDQCVAANDEETDCLAKAIRQRLDVAQRNIDAQRGTP